MSTTPVPAGPPTIPLAPDVLAAYNALYKQYETAIEGTADTTLSEALLTSQLAVAQVIQQNNQYILNQNTAAYAAILKVINNTNQGLSDLQAQIKKIDGDISLYAGIVGGIAKVLTLVPGV
jgi:hypothetical protein